jgi:methionine aminotransferase
MLAPASKLPQVGTTIFTTMSVLAQQHQAVNLGQGFPDFGMDPLLTQYVFEAMQSGMNQYIHMNGYPLLREKLADKYNRLYHTNIDPNTEITITPGATYALYTAISTVVQPGDEVIVLEPAYDSYIPNIEINGGKVVTVPLAMPDFRVDWDAVEQAITSKTKAIVINSPHNPTGALLSEEDMQQLEKIVEGTGIYIISDEVYEHLIFDGKTHESVLRYPALRARSFACYSFGKTYHCTGWKLGYCIAPPALMHEFRKIHQFNAFTSNTPMQVGLARYLDNEKAYREVGQELQAMRDYFQAGMADTRFQPVPSYGSYFQVYSYASISDEPEQAFAERLTREHGVTGIPVAAFYREPVNRQLIRFCFVKQRSTIDQALERLRHV